MAKYLTREGLQTFFTGLKGKFVAKESGKGLSTNDLTSSLKTKYDAAYTHSTSAHAPSSAQANVIETVKLNGTVLTPSSKAVDITVDDTTYTLSTAKSAPNGSVGVLLTDSNNSTDSFAIKGSGATTVTTDANGAITIASTDTNTVYTHPSSGATAGTYKSVTINAQGHVTAGTNPTTAAGYGITDVYTKSAADTAIATAVANAPHLKRSIVAALPTASNADANTIYMIKDSTATGEDKYKEYMLIDSALVMTGDTSVDMSDYIKVSDIETITTTDIDAILES